MHSPELNRKTYKLANAKLNDKLKVLQIHLKIYRLEI